MAKADPERHATPGRNVGAYESASDFIERQTGRLPTRLFEAKDIGGEGRLYWRCEAVTLRQQSNYPQKVDAVMRMRLERVEGVRLRSSGAQISDVEYRLCYYTVARDGRWHWGQYALITPPDDLVALLQQARLEGTLLDDFEVRSK